MWVLQYVSVVFIFCNTLLGFFHDSCKVVVSLNNCFRGAVKAVSFVQYCTASSQGCTHFWEGCHVTYSFSMFLSGLMNISGPCLWMLFFHGWNFLRMNLVYQPWILVIIFLSVCIHLELTQPLSHHHAIWNTRKCLFALLLKHSLYTEGIPIARGKRIIL